MSGYFEHLIHQTGLSAGPVLRRGPVSLSSPPRSLEGAETKVTRTASTETPLPFVSGADAAPARRDGGAAARPNRNPAVSAPTVPAEGQAEADPRRDSPRVDTRPIGSEGQPRRSPVEAWDAGEKRGAVPAAAERHLHAQATMPRAAPENGQDKQVLPSREDDSLAGADQRGGREGGEGRTRPQRWWSAVEAARAWVAEEPDSEPPSGPQNAPNPAPLPRSPRRQVAPEEGEGDRVSLVDAAVTRRDLTLSIGAIHLTVEETQDEKVHRKEAPGEPARPSEPTSRPIRLNRYYLRR